MGLVKLIFSLMLALDQCRGKNAVKPREMVLNSIFRDIKYAPQSSPSKLPIPLHCGKSKYKAHHANFYGSVGKRPSDQSDDLILDEVRKRIVGGKISESGEWPWLVSMQLFMNGTAYEHLCGGSLIHPQWVLSTAHCYEDFWASYLTSNPDSWKVRVGEHFMFEHDDTQEEIEVEMIFFHPGRNPKISTSNDIALVKLARPVELNENINVVCLPTLDDDFEPGTPCLTAGWGHSVEGGIVSAVVQHVQIPILPSDLCQDMYNKIPDKIMVSILDSMICAGLETGGKDACQYDSGGPLVHYDRIDHKWILIGIVSTGYGCARPGFPGIYTKVSSFLPWIESTVDDN